MLKIIIMLFIISQAIFPQERNMLLLKFDEPLDSASALNIANYSIYKYEDFSNLNIYDIKFVNAINNIPIKPPRSQIVLFIDRPEYKKEYKLVVIGVKDTSNNAITYNYINFNFDGIKYEFTASKPNLRKVNK